MYNMCIVMVSFIVEKTWLQQRKSMTFWKSLTTLILITPIVCSLIWRLSSNFYFNNIKSYLLHLSSFWFFLNFNAHMLIAMEYFNPHICLFYYLFFHLWLFFCRNGCTRSGLLVAISLVIEQKELDEEVDIFQVVRLIQTRRPALLLSIVSFIYFNI